MVGSRLPEIPPGPAERLSPAATGELFRVLACNTVMAKSEGSFHLQ